MSFQERQAIGSIIGTIVISALYFAYVLPKFPDAAPYSVEVFRYWGSVILILIPVSIVTKIALAIVLSILNAVVTRKDEAPVIDERDKAIELKAARISLYIFAVGIVLSMASLVIDQPPSVMFIVLIISGIVAEMVDNLSQLVFYRRGV